MSVNHSFGSYITPINFRHTAVTQAAGTIPWALVNGTTRRMFIRRIRVDIISDVAKALTGGAAVYGFKRITSGAVLTTSGTQQTPSKKSTDYPASAIADLRYLNTGLGVGTAVMEADPFLVVAGADAQLMTMDNWFDSDGVGFYELAPGEGVAIVLLTASAIGVGLYGNVCWDERLP